MRQLIKTIKLLIFGNQIKWVKFSRDIYDRYIITIQKDDLSEDIFITTNGIDFFNFNSGDKASDSLAKTLNKYFINYYYFYNEE